MITTFRVPYIYDRLDALFYRSNLGSFNHEKRGLIIQQPWLDLILTGQKTMDLRSSDTQIRGEVAILHDGKIWGYVNLYDTVGPMTAAEIMNRELEHHVPYSKVGDYDYGWLFKDVRVLKYPRKYNHPKGAQIWVKL